MPDNKGYQHDTLPPNPKPSLEKTLSMSKGDADGDDVDTSCGYFCLKPWCTHTCCNTPKGLGIAVSFYAFEYGVIVLGVINIIIVPLQRRYGFTATQAAWIPASQDFFGGIFAIIFGYIGTFVHKGRLMTLSAFCQFLGCSMFVMIHFISPVYEAGGAEMEICDPEAELSCEVNRGNDMYFWLFISAQFLMGLSGGILWCVAVPYMDENMKAKNTPLYIGIMYAMSAAGAMLGYILGGFMLTVYVDIGRVDMDDIGITPDDPRWVGAWWIPYVIAVFTALIALIYLGAYPKYIPVAAKYQAERKTEAYGGGEDVQASAGAVAKLWQSTKILMTNPTFLLLTLAGIFESGLMVGFIVFFPAIVVFQFDQNPAEAAVIAGVVIVPAAIGGQVLGGLIPRWMDLRVRGLIAQTGICALAVALLSPVLLLKCPTPPIAGVTVAFNDTNLTISDIDFEDTCNEPCGCDTRAYDPICGTNGVQYFTPCHAGCLNNTVVDGDEFFIDCMCIPPVDDVFHDATSGSCDGDCDLFFWFLGAFFFCVLAIFIGVTSGIAAVVRCVPEAERSYGTGLQSTIVRFLGNVPFPLMMGAIFDRSCLVWQYTCEERGSCWLYNPEDLARGLFIMVLVSKSLAVVCHICSICLYKPPPGEEEDIVRDVNVGGDTEKSDYSKENTAYVQYVGEEMKEKSPNGNAVIFDDDLVKDFFGRDETITKL